MNKWISTGERMPNALWEGWFIYNGERRFGQYYADGNYWFSNGGDLKPKNVSWWLEMEIPPVPVQYFPGVTPVPYRIGKIGDRGVPSMIAIVSDSSEGLEKVGGATDTEYYGGNMIAESVTPENGVFIVKACNSFERLVEFLRSAEESEDMQGGHAGTEARDLRIQLESEGVL